MTTSRAPLAAVLALTSSGCVTLARGTIQEIRFTSDPPGATVKMSGQEGITPCGLVLTRGHRESMVTFELEGRETYRGEIQPRELLAADEPGMVFLAIGSGLLILPGIVDLSSGALMDWPYELHATMPARGEGTALLDVSRKKPPDYQRPHREVANEE